MVSPELWKRWKASDALLRGARLALPDVSDSRKEEFDRLDNTFAEMLDHNEYEVALDMIQEMGLIAQPRGGFWKDLERVAQLSDLDHRIPLFRSEFNKALARLPRTEPDIADNSRLPGSLES